MTCVTMMFVAIVLLGMAKMLSNLCVYNDRQGQ